MQKKKIQIYSLGLLFSFFGILSSTQAQTFFARGADNKIEKVDLSFKILDDKLSIELQNAGTLSRFSDHPDQIASGPIATRGSNAAEQTVDAAFMIMLSFMVMSSHDNYDLAPDLRMSSFYGLMFFVFPFEFHYLYKKCPSSSKGAGLEYLVAISGKQVEEISNPDDLKSVEEVRRICEMGSTSTTQPSANPA